MFQDRTVDNTLSSTLVNTEENLNGTATEKHQNIQTLSNFTDEKIVETQPPKLQQINSLKHLKQLKHHTKKQYYVTTNKIAISSKTRAFPLMSLNGTSNTKAKNEETFFYWTKVNQVKQFCNHDFVTTFFFCKKQY